MESDFSGPINIGSDELISINDLAKLAMRLAKKNVVIKHIKGPLGVRGRCSDNTLIEKKLGWRPTWSLEKGLELTYQWISEQVKKKQEKTKV